MRGFPIHWFCRFILCMKQFSGNLTIWMEFRLFSPEVADTIYYAVSIYIKNEVITCYIEHEYNRFSFWALNVSHNNFSYFVFVIQTYKTWNDFNNPSPYSIYKSIHFSECIRCKMPSYPYITYAIANKFFNHWLQIMDHSHRRSLLRCLFGSFRGNYYQGFDVINHWNDVDFDAIPFSS